MGDGTERKRDRWTWTPQRDEAAELVAFAALSHDQIAARLKIGKSTLTNWKGIPEFAERVSAIRERIRAEAEAQRRQVRDTGYAVIEERVRAKQSLLEALDEVRRCRAEAALSDPDLMAQGGGTGLVLRRAKGVGQGPAAMVVDEYHLDNELVRTTIALHDAIARDLGQHVTRQEVAGAVVGGIDAGAARVEIIFEDQAPKPVAD